jgi:hypothetical protein
MVDVKAVKPFRAPVPLQQVKDDPALAEMAALYYKKHIGPDAGKISEEFSNWMGLEDAEVSNMLHVDDNQRFWKYQAQKNVDSKWASLARFLLSVVVQSATCERMFKTYKMQHTAVRNRLELTKTTKLVQIKMGQERTHKQAADALARDMAPPSTTTVHNVISKNRVLKTTEFTKLDNGATIAPMVGDDDFDADEGVNWSHLEQDPAKIIAAWSKAVDDAVAQDDGPSTPLDPSSVQYTLEEGALEDDRRPYPVTNDRAFPQEVLRDLSATNLRNTTLKLRVIFGNAIDLA